MRRNFLLGMLFLFLISFTFIPSIVGADSGWDSDYGGGSSSSGGGSWSSSSDGDSSGDWGSDNEISTDVIVVCFLILIVLTYFYIKKPLQVKTEESTEVYSPYDEDVSDERLLVYGLSKITLKKEFFQKFVSIQEAWMNFDYDKLKELCTDELYNSYRSQLEVLKLKNGQNIMSDYSAEKIVIVNIEEDESRLIVEVYMRISFFDYVINTKTNNVIRGQEDRLLTNDYLMTFVRSKDNLNDLVECPNCGRNTHINSRGECDYCGSIIVKEASDFVLSKKEKIN